MRGGSKLCYKIYTLNTIIFDEEEKCFLTLPKDLNVSRK